MNQPGYRHLNIFPGYFKQEKSEAGVSLVDILTVVPGMARDKEGAWSQGIKACVVRGQTSLTIQTGSTGYNLENGG